MLETGRGAHWNTGFLLPMLERQRAGFRDFFEWLLALRIVQSERLVFVDDPRNIFSQDVSRRRPLTVAAILGFLFHVLLVLIVWPSLGATELPLTTEKFVIKQLARPALLEGAAGRPVAPPPKPNPVAPDPKPKFVPIPDPTPDAPEPIRRVAVEIPRILEELAVHLNIGEIEAPPGPPSRGGRGLGNQGGSGVGRRGLGDGAGGGDGIFQVGGDVSMPVLLVKTTPAYTDDAIKSKVQGVVLLRGVVRSNGQVDTLSVVRGLGYGLEENAIREIASNWKFRPGMRNGQAVDVWATIEVTFNLR